MKNVKIVIAGIGTGVGKTVTSAVITTMFAADYWKPIESDNKNSDVTKIKTLVDPSTHRFFPPVYSFKAPLSPHHASHLENVTIEPEKIIPPQTDRSLVIEMAGGIFVPLNTHALSMDLFLSWKAAWVIVSKHYLGSINHTLLTIDALKKRHANILGIVFNGKPNPGSEQVILEMTKLPCIGRLLPEKHLNQTIIKRYAKKWQHSL